MPAILKGWFDRVWARGVAFELPPGGGAITPALVNIKKFAVITTYGSPWWLIKLVLRDPVRAVIMGGLGRLCAPRVQTRFLALYNIDTANRQRCARFLERVERALARF
jgi:putative NADPH-quinone reductase